MQNGSWKHTELHGTEQFIPHVCPNCLKRATIDLRYYYVHPLARVAPTKYVQTFRYCADCAPAAQAHISHEQWTGWMYRIPGAMFLLLPPVLAIAMLRDKGILSASATSDPASGALILALMALGPILAWGMERLLFVRAKRKHPQQAHQACWGVAAYFTGQTLFSNQNRYIAVREDWLELLAEANVSEPQAKSLAA
jgi:hypothetical protein